MDLLIIVGAGVISFYAGRGIIRKIFGVSPERKPATKAYEPRKSARNLPRLPTNKPGEGRAGGHCTDSGPTGKEQNA